MSQDRIQWNRTAKQASIQVKRSETSIFKCMWILNVMGFVMGRKGWVRYSGEEDNTQEHWKEQNRGTTFILSFTG